MRFAPVIILLHECDEFLSPLLGRLVPQGLCRVGGRMVIGDCCKPDQKQLFKLMGNACSPPRRPQQPQGRCQRAFFLYQTTFPLFPFAEDERRRRPRRSARPTVLTVCDDGLGCSGPRQLEPAPPSLSQPPHFRPTHRKELTTDSRRLTVCCCAPCFACSLLA